MIKEYKYKEIRIKRKVIETLKRNWRTRICEQKQEQVDGVKRRKLRRRRRRRRVVVKEEKEEIPYLTKCQGRLGEENYKGETTEQLPLATKHSHIHPSRL